MTEAEVELLRFEYLKVAATDDTDHYYGAWIGGPKRLGGHPAFSSGPRPAPVSVSGWPGQPGPGLPAVIPKVQEAVLGDRNPYETGIVLDDQGNTIIAHKGSTDFVQFTPDDIDRMRGATLIHNHPSGWLLPDGDPEHRSSGFSPDDIGLAVTADLAEIQAVTPTRIFSLRPGPKGWPSPASVTWAYREAERTIRERFQKRIIGGWKPWGDTEALRTKWANSEHHDAVARMVAKKFGWQYQVVQR